MQKRQNLSELSFFWAILGVFFRFERLCFSGGILYRQPFKSRCLSLPGNKKAPYRYDAFCLARKMEQGNAIQLSVVLFLSADNRCTDGCTAADKQQREPQGKIEIITGLRRFGIVLQLRRYGVGFFDSLCTVLVAVIFTTAFAVPILDIALGGLGRRSCREVL
mgnify:CR=1 FL=1